ncbi:MAG: translesion DNA synthesis-associated protein ImuA [Lautropia sp.]|nr:translesion DNA synthesis-associated protein ImuA [Lautropia sp.]
MSSALSPLEQLIDRRQLWRAQATAPAMTGVPTGLPGLDAALPLGGWPEAALIELLLPAEGLGDMQLLWPTLARLTQAGCRVVLVGPPFIPFAPAWQQAGVRLDWLEIIEADARDALWAFEQCLRSGCCEAVLGWPRQADHTALRRLQVAADQGRCLGFVFRHARHAVQPSPAALRLQLLSGARLQVLKCRGGMVDGRPVSWCGDGRLPPGNRASDGMAAPGAPAGRAKPGSGPGLIQPDMARQTSFLAVG